MSAQHPARARARAMAALWASGALWANGVLCGVVAAADPGAAAAAPSVLASPVMPATDAASKIDPRLLAALVAHPAAAAPVRQAGTSAAGGEGSLAVILCTSLDDDALAALGAEVGSRAGELVTARVAASDLGRLAADPGVTAIEGAQCLAPTLDASIPEIGADLVYQGGAGYTGRGVIVGIIDTGIDHTHEDFRDEEGESRILAIWAQDALAASPPSGFTYGREYTRSQIDRGLAAAHRDDEGHGTHVAGIAAGDGTSLATAKYRGVAWNADLLVVRNYGRDIFTYGGTEPFASAPTTVGTIDALVYLLNKARTLGRPLVVNLSQGTSMGPHDGTSLFEQMLDGLVRDEGLILCVAAGNGGAEHGHGRVRVTGSAGQITLSHSAQPDPLGDILFECWYAPGDRFDWEIESPNGGLVAVSGNAAPAGGLLLGLGAYPDSVCSWATPAHPVNGQGYALFWLCNRSDGLGTGTWTVRAIAANGLPAGGVVDLYCERNQEGVRVVQGLSQTGTIGMPGSATEPISVGSYNTKLQWQGEDGWHTTAQLGYTENPLGAISLFSSQGPRRDGVIKPDLAAPGLIIASARSATYEIEAGFNDPGGAHTYLMGTSMASPHVAGAIALMLEKNPALTPSEVKSILQQTARRDAYTGSTPGNTFGYGKLDVQAAVAAVPGGDECATLPGDAGGDGDVDVFDLVAAVNDIIGRTALGAGAELCADVNGDRVLNVQDLTLIVGLILGTEGGDGGTMGPRCEPDTLAWTESCTPEGYRLTLTGAAIAAVQIAYMLPRGFALAGEPSVAAPGTASVAHHARLGQHYLVGYAHGGLLAGPGEAVEIAIPMTQRREGGEDCGRFAVTGLLATDRAGRRLALRQASDPPNEPPPAGTGVAAFLERIRPNPTRGCTTIRYALETSGAVRIDIHDAGGRLVRRLHDGWQMAGEHSLVWDGRDGAGAVAPGGVYFARLKSAGGSRAQEIVLVR